jgi:small subunit ribosomal protein S27e
MRITAPTFPVSKFVKIACRKCKNIQIAFNKPSTIVKCIKCGDVLAIPTGGQAKFKGRIVSVLT